MSARPRPAVITLLTDFGHRDAYVGIMKGVILGINPEARLVDLSHEVPPQDIVFGALVLQSAWRYFPPGTIHLAVVDPGVGSARRGLAAGVAGHFLVGPDNGIFSLILAASPPETVVSLENPRYFLPEVSATFHGRDMFAPVAAHLSLGMPLTDFGPVLGEPVCLDLPAPRFTEAAVYGRILTWDHFGNLITNIPYRELQAWLRGQSAQVWVADRPIPHWVKTYSEAPPGALLALEGSHGYLEIAVREGNAAAMLCAGPGTLVQIIPRNSSAGSGCGQ